MSENWQYKITHVTPGEPVQAGTVSRPDRALADRTEYLKVRLDAAEAGKAIFDLDATVSVDVLPGQAVYWNAQEKRYEPAIVVIETDAASQSLVSRPSSDCVGLCYRKTAANKADIVLRGLVTFPELTNAIGDTVAPGKYYLSAVTPGHLSQQKPPITVAVCYVLGPRDNCSDELRVIVCPQVRDFLDEHTHYRFDLVAQPAGNVSIVDDRVRVSGNDTLQGWLPANHASFNGKAPVGAKFGYNIRKHAALSRVWPPIPIQSVAMLWDKGQNLIGATEIPLGTTGAAIVDINGIWWMSDCQEDVPWPAATITAGQCEREEKMRVIIVFLRLLFGNNRRVVTSLDKDPVSPVQITNCDGVVSQTGDLKLDLNLEEVDCEPIAAASHRLSFETIEARDAALVQQFNLYDVVRVGLPGSYAYYRVNDIVNNVITWSEELVSDETYELGAKQAGKIYNDAVVGDKDVGNKNKLKKSWVAEGVIAHNIEQLSVSGTWSRKLTNEEKIYHDFVGTGGVPITEDVLAHQGLIKINFDDQYADKELAPQIIRLDDAVERIYMDIPYLGFPQGQDSSIRVRINVPYVNVLGGSLMMKMRLQVFTRGGTELADGPVGELLMTYRKLTAPNPVTNPAIKLPDDEAEIGPSVPVTVGGTTTNVPLIPTGLTAKRDYVIQVESQAFSVTHGDTILVSFSRLREDATLGEVGILRLSGILFKPTTT
jgi:hypothetical protein